MEHHIDSFLHNLKLIIKETTSLLPNDPMIYRVNKRLSLAIQYDPLYIFNKVGEYLYKYRTFVYDESTENLLLEWKFEETKDIKNPEIEDITILLISQLKMCLQKMNVQGKSFFRKLTSELLDSYIEYKYMTIEASK